MTTTVGEPTRNAEGEMWGLVLRPQRALFQTMRPLFCAKKRGAEEGKGRGAKGEEYTMDAENNVGWAARLPRSQCMAAR